MKKKKKKPKKLYRKNEKPHNSHAQSQPTVVYLFFIFSHLSLALTVNPSSLLFKIRNSFYFLFHLLYFAFDFKQTKLLHISKWVNGRLFPSFARFRIVSSFEANKNETARARGEEEEENTAQFSLWARTFIGQMDNNSRIIIINRIKAKEKKKMLWTAIRANTGHTVNSMVLVDCMLSEMNTLH